MRLINADDIPYAVNIDHPSGEFDYAYRCEIDALPTVDAVPVVHGKWFVSTDGMLHCSNCSEIPTNRIRINADMVYDMTPIRETMRYCPNCGARMVENE